MNKGTPQANNERISIFECMNGRVEGVGRIPTLQAQRRTKGRIINKSFCLISFGNDTYPTPPAFFFTRENLVTK